MVFKWKPALCGCVSSLGKGAKNTAKGKTDPGCWFFDMWLVLLKRAESFCCWIIETNLTIVWTHKGKLLPLCGHVFAYMLPVCHGTSTNIGCCVEYKGRISIYRMPYITRLQVSYRNDPIQAKERTTKSGESQDCPPQDCPHGGQSWGGQSCALSVIRIAPLNYNTFFSLPA